MGTPFGDFVRARRDATRPEALGLPVGPRRRAPGLRRSELADRAGISVEYLVRIEQGRDRNPSIPVINAIAEALQLSSSERVHLTYLSKMGSAREAPKLQRPNQHVRDAVLRVLEQFEPGIALLTNGGGDLLAYTSGFELIARPVGLLDGPEENLTRFVFTAPNAATVFPDWNAMADDCVFHLWRTPCIAAHGRLVAELEEAVGEQFTQRLDAHVVPRPRTLRWMHPEAGELRFERETMELSPDDGQLLVAFLPTDDATADAVADLRRGGAQRLRAVN